MIYNKNGATDLKKLQSGIYYLIKVSMETQDFESVRNFGFVSDIDLSFDKKGDLIYAQWIDDGPQSISFKNTTASKVFKH